MKKLLLNIFVPNQTKAWTTCFVAGVALVTHPQTAPARTVGLDVSHFQGSGINWTSVKGDGRSFAWSKATEGTGTTDADFSGNISRGKAAGVIMGAYHFAHPESDSPASEENHFWSVAGSTIKADGKTLMPMLDMEVFSGHTGATSYSDWANQFNKDLVSDAKAASVKIKPAIYVSACNACEFGSSVAQWLSDIADYNGESSQTGTPWSTCSSCNPWDSGDWDFWQYSDSGAVSGVSGGVDVDVINGTSVTPYVATTTHVGSWHFPWTSIGGSFSANIASCSWAANRLDMLGVGLNGGIYHKAWNGAWSPASTSWESLVGTYGTNWHGDIGAVSWGANRIDFFVQGTNNHCYHGYYTTAGLGGMQDLGGVFDANIGFGAAAWGANRLDVFGVSPGVALYHNAWNGTAWSGWVSLGGILTSTPAAVSWGPNRIDVFSRGTNSECFQIAWNGSSWSSFLGRGGEFDNYGYGAASQGSGLLDVFGIGTNDEIYQLDWDGNSWDSWNSLDPGVSTSSPSAVSWGAGRIDAFIRSGSSGECYHLYFN